MRVALVVWALLAVASVVLIYNNEARQDVRLNRVERRLARVEAINHALCREGIGAIAVEQTAGGKFRYTLPSTYRGCAPLLRQR